MSYVHLRRGGALPTVEAGKAKLYLEQVKRDDLKSLVNPAQSRLTYGNVDDVRLLVSSGLTHDMPGAQFNWLRNSGFWFTRRTNNFSNLPAWHTTATTRTITADGWGVTTSGANDVTYQGSKGNSGNVHQSGVCYWRTTIAAGAPCRKLITQVLEFADTLELRGKTVRLQAHYDDAARGITPSTLLQNGGLRMAIAMLSGGTADALPATFVNNLATEGAMLDLGTNLTFIEPLATGLDNATVDRKTLLLNPYRFPVRGQVGDTFASTFEAPRCGGLFTIPTNAQNLIVMFWSDRFGGSEAFGDYTFLARPSLTVGQGVQPVPWTTAPNAMELARLQRYFAKSAPDNNNPALTGGLAGPTYGIVNATGTAAGQIIGVRFPNTMRAVPTMTLFNGASTANAFVRNFALATDASATAAANISENGLDVTFTGLGGGGAWQIGQAVGIHWSADAEL